MSAPRDKGISPAYHRDLEPTKQIGNPANLSIVGHISAVMGNINVRAGHRGAAHRKQGQHGYYDSDNHPLDTHDGLPDIGPKMEWDKYASASANLFFPALGIYVT